MPDLAQLHAAILEKKPPLNYYGAERSGWLRAQEHFAALVQEAIEREAADVEQSLPRVTMILCPQCGNKRCPKATYHILACTGSNDPGQPGSRYKATPPSGD